MAEIKPINRLKDRAPDLVARARDTNVVVGPQEVEYLADKYYIYRGLQNAQENGSVQRNEGNQTGIDVGCERLSSRIEQILATVPIK